ncbi:MAG: HAD-IC family P-type ATPase, partial [Acidimicrobiales bacterium]
MSDALTGLTSADVAERVADGRTNDVPDAPVRSNLQIIQANVLTPVNGIISTLFVLILVAGYPADALFAGVVVSNSVIGIAQEFQARRTLTELAVLSAPKARVRRDGETTEVGVSEVVADDVLELSPGDQVVVDGDVLAESGLELDESLLTGESDPVEKAVGDAVLSGSFVSAGSGFYRATHIGAESYAAKLSEEARRFELAGSELRRGVNVILRWLTFIIPPASILLLLRQLDTQSEWQDALQATVAAAVAMVPDGLVLLTSLSFIAGVVALARRQALAKELASVELLARVDTLCLDKTGTITTGEISLASIKPVGGTTDGEAAEILGALGASDPSPNATLQAIIEHYDAPDGWTVTNSLPFSSARKWAATEFGDRGTFYLGAPDILFDADDVERVHAAEAAADGLRVLLVSRSDSGWHDQELAETRTPVCLVLLEDTIRP